MSQQGQVQPQGQAQPQQGGQDQAQGQGPIQASQPDQGSNHGQLSGQSQAALSNAPPLSAYRPLNVKDALSYLDQVKVQFQNRPDVYNHFLDIMKDFKSQSIDTPGVIERVSTLFRGHPGLIQGFNTFLPPGYKIECFMDPSDPNAIRVTTPLGTTTTIAEAKPRMMYEQAHEYDGQKSHTFGQPPSLEQQQQLGQAQHLAPGQPGYGQQDLYFGSQNQSSLSQLQDAANERKSGGPVEFNHAINYVNKIKTRFSNQPDIYKHFLEILQTYQREQKPIAEVYSQVTILFQNAPDLLDDFKQFLPDPNQTEPLSQQQQQQPEYYQQSGQAQLPPVGNFSPPAVDGKGKRIDGADKFDQGKFNKEIPTSNLRGSVSSTARPRVSDAVPTLVPGVPEPVEPAVRTSNMIEEISFFDKVKKAIGSKQSYNEFLKIINLFNQDLIDKEILIERTEGFIGSHSDLFDWFKSFVGYEDKPYHIENITFKKHQLDLLLCKPYGPSYRKLPKVESYMPCSGRDDMCWEVLNDEWVGHPTWASEDSGFIAHRKNQYEEMLFRIEEERHEYDYYMESNLRTIQTFETLANRIANMTPEEKASFKLPNGLGHTSQTIYKKVIRKIYGKEKGFEVIDALHDNLALAIPVILKRLKQKDEEWRRAHREWNKVWREMEQKVFFKSLDHLGLTFKQNDKKLLTVKQLVSEISTIKSEQTNKRLHPLTPKPQKQLDYKFEDNEIFFDIIKLVYVFLNSSTPYSINDKERIYDFLKSFVALFFSIDPEVVDEAAIKRIPNQSSENVHPKEPVTGTPTMTSTEFEGTRKRHHETDLLKDVLKKSKMSKLAETPASPSQESNSNDVDSKDGEESEEEDFDITSDSWIKTANSELANGETVNANRTVFNLFGNTNIYVFFRHFRALYERLLEVKKINAEVTHDLKSRSDVKFAKDLNLISNQLEDLGLQFTKDSDAYSQLLAISEKLIDGEIEHQWFEESLRQAYRNRAYKLYTIDKVIQSLVKHLHSILQDAHSSAVILLFETDRKKKTTSAKDQIIYRNNVRPEMNADENMFRIEYNQDSHVVSIQYVALDDLTLQDHKTAKDKYNYYLTSYVIAHPTEGVNISEVRLPFTKSTDIEDADPSEQEGYTDSQLAIHVAKESYKLSFEPSTRDEFTRYSTYNTPAKQNAKVPLRLPGVIDEKLSEIIEDDDELKASNERIAALKVSVEEFQKVLEAQKIPKAVEVANEESDQDETIEKVDETGSDGSKKVNPVIASVQDQDVTLDGDATIPDDTEIKANDTTYEQNNAEENSNTLSTVTSSADVKTATTEATLNVDGDGDTKMG